ncbi:protein of unknown function [Methylorubrum extorquens DM4]|uniref:Uncharacterized protein n=1 Tax=Methylorubrum extorquens (strain DSM 6343 / CIP 106787 / DM4) TaxID=661410 RepID=C7CA66_METED|nr:protein of unknown function [Methylorubrum extorquens DM4]
MKTPDIRYNSELQDGIITQTGGRSLHGSVAPDSAVTAKSQAQKRSNHRHFKYISDNMKAKSGLKI